MTVLLVVVYLLLASIVGALLGMFVTIMFSFGNDYAMKRNIIIFMMLSYAFVFYKCGVFNG